MRFVFRLLWLLVVEMCGPRAIDFFASSRVRTVVLPGDFAAGGRRAALAYVELGRIAWSCQRGVLWLGLRHRVAATGDNLVMIQRSSPAPFTRIVVETRVLGWETSSCHLQHRVVTPDGAVVMVVDDRGVMWRRGAARLGVADYLILLARVRPETAPMLQS